MQIKQQINLLRGWPAPALLPATSLIEASSTILSDPTTAIPALQYGPDEGYYPLRQYVAKWLDEFYAEAVERDLLSRCDEDQEVPRSRQGVDESRICVTGGASQNLACVLQVFTDPVVTRAIFMIAPTYFLACRIFEDAGFAGKTGKLRGVPEDEEGVDISFLRRELEEQELKRKAEGNDAAQPLKPERPWTRYYRYVIYGVPTFANPSSKVMSLARRIALVKLAREFDALLVTDDVYDMLQWEVEPSSTVAAPTTPSPSSFNPNTALLPRLVDIDHYLDGGPQHEWGNTLSNGSFSKLIGPGCRVGWAEASPKMAWGLSQTGSSRSGGSPSHFTSTLVSTLFSPSPNSDSSILTSHITKILLPAYKTRYNSILTAINTHLVPLGLTLPQPQNTIAGGFFIWLTLPETFPITAESLAKIALKEEKVIIAEGALFRVQESLKGLRGEDKDADLEFDRNFRLCFTWVEEDVLTEGVERIASVIRRVMEDEVWRAEMLRMVDGHAGDGADEHK